MKNVSMFAQTIKDSVSALDVAAAIGWDVQHGRCRCPIHNGGDRNCRLYPGNRGFHCFSCGASGDVLSLVQQYYNMSSFKSVLEWFNDTFSLGMDIDSPVSTEAAKQAENARKTREEERAFLEWKERMRFDLALTADRIVEKLEEQRDRNVPKRPDEPWNRQFCEAVRLLPAAERFAQECMFRCMKEVKE